MLFAAVAAAQTIEPQGTIASISFDPSDPNRLYVGSYGVLYASADGGASWYRSAQPMVAWSVAISPRDTTADPNDGTVIFAGTQNRGVLTSADFANSWMIDPSWAETIRAVTASADGSVVYAGSETALYRTTDRGGSWAVLSDQLGTGLVEAIVLAPNDPNTIYVAKIDHGVYRSLDGGVSWQLGAAGMDDVRLKDLDIDPTNPALLFATSLSAVYRSVDAGTNWQQVAFPQATFDFALDPVNPERMFAATTIGGMYRSLDGGLSWSAVNDGLGGVEVFFSVAVAPDGSGKVYAGSMDYGLFESTDYGGSWRSVSGVALPPVTPPPPPADPGYPSLSLKLTDLQNGGSVSAGGYARYRLEVTNSGESVATAAELYASWVMMPFLFGDTTPMSRSMTTSRGTCDTEGHCSFGDLAPGERAVVEFSGATRSGALRSYRLTASWWAENTGRGSQSATIGSSVTVFESGGGGALGPLGIAALALLTLTRLILRGSAAKPARLSPISGRSESLRK